MLTFCSFFFGKSHALSKFQSIWLDDSLIGNRIRPRRNFRSFKAPNLKIKVPKNLCFILVQKGNVLRILTLKISSMIYTYLIVRIYKLKIFSGSKYLYYQRIYTKVLSTLLCQEHIYICNLNTFLFLMI